MMFILHNTIFLILITVKKTCSEHVVNYYVVYFILSIDSRGISTSSFHGYAELINYKVGNICWVFQDAILINYP